MMRSFTLACFFLVLGFSLRAQDFKIVDFTGGYYQPHAVTKQMKLVVTRRWQPLSSFDYNKDGRPDSIFYRWNAKNGGTGEVVAYDPRTDDWAVLFSHAVSDMKSSDGIWFYQTTFTEAGPPVFVVYVVKEPYKGINIIQWDGATNKFSSKEYSVEYKSFFPHKLVVNKKKIINQNATTEDSFEEVPVE